MKRDDWLINALQKYHIKFQHKNYIEGQNYGGSKAILFQIHFLEKTSLYFVRYCS